MKASELKNYKTLDITKISGTPWNTAEKVLGLDENDKVVMAETDESVSPEYVENAISEAMEVETSRTESTYAKKSEVTGYTTTEEVNQAIETAMETETARTENTYAKPADIPSLDGYAKTTAVTEEIQTAIAAETARTEDVYAKKSEVPDLDNYYTKSETDEAIEEAISGISLDGYWTSGQTKTYVDSEITAATEDMATTGWVESQGYLTEHQDISGKLDTSVFTGYTGTTDTTISGKLDKSDFNTYTGATETALAGKLDATAYTIDNVFDSASTNPVQNRVITNALDNYATKEDLTGGTETIIRTLEVGGDSTSTTLTIRLDNGKVLTDYTYPLKETNVGYLLVYDVSSYNSPVYSILSVSDNNTVYYPVTDGDEYIGDFKLVFDLSTTQTGKLKFPYEGCNWLIYNTIDHTLTFASSLPTWSETVQTTGILDDYWTTGETQNAITAATQDMATKTWVGEQGYLTQHQDISGKLDKTDFNTYTGATATAIAAKQDALVSGTNIKTINNQSILGSGNIDIQGGSGPIIPAITSQAEYEAISGDVQTGDLIQVYGVDINDDGGEAYGLFQADYVGEDSIAWVRKDNVDSLMWSGQFYPWMGDKGVWPVDFGEGSFLISTDDNSEDEAYNGIGFDDNGKPVTTHIVPEYDEQTGEITGVTRTDTPIGADDGSIVRYDIDREAELANAGYNTKLVTQEYDENEGATLPTIVGHMEEGILNGVKIDGHSIAKVSGYIHQQSEPTPGPVFDFTQNDELATQAYVTAATENLASQGYVDAAITAATNDLATEAYVTAATATKLDTSVYSAYTGSTATAIAAKQDTLVSGTNIKTINNQSLLGSGNIDIQGGGGGGSVVELTQAQYDALDPPAQDTTYIITDAETVDLNDYAMASGLTELSGTVETLSSTKADKQNVTARSAPYLPSWNAQGVITGSTSYYNKGQGINGTTYNVFSNSNTNHPAIFAPTSAGTAGQPLLSNGSGAPVWASVKFAFVSQSQYDALVTKDSSTIYFIVDPS